MNRRLFLYELIQRHSLNQNAAQRLSELLSLSPNPAPKNLHTIIMLGLRVLAAALLGFGAILWVAANWDAMSKGLRFGLLEGTLLIQFLLCVLLTKWRQPIALMAFLCIGGLLACFGQIYQTGTDPWQLFALWAVLGLPIALSTRHDLLWLPWVLVAMTALSLWLETHSSHFWRFTAAYVMPHLLGWLVGLSVVVFLSPFLRQRSGAGDWSWRLALTLLAMLMTYGALKGLWNDDAPILYFCGLALLTTATAILWRPRFYDVYALSVVALSVNFLLVFGLAKLLTQASSGMGGVFMIGMCAAGMLAFSVTLILKRDRQMHLQAQDQ